MRGCGCFHFYCVHRLPLMLPRVPQEVKNAELPDHIADPGGDGGDSDKFDALITWLQTPVGAGGREAQVSEFPLLYMKRYSENNRGVHCRVDIGVSWAARVGMLQHSPLLWFSTYSLLVCYCCHHTGWRPNSKCATPLLDHCRDGAGAGDRKTGLCVCV